LTGLVVFAVASGLCGVAPSVPLLVAARALQAVGAALLVPASLALLLPEFPASQRAAAVGLWGAAGAVAAASGPVLGALLVEGPGWRWVFYVNLPFCAAAVLLGRRVLRESTGTVTTSRPDVLGVLLVTAVFGLLSLGIVQGEQWGWSSIRVVGALLVAALLTPVLVLRSLRHPDPALPVDPVPGAVVLGRHRGDAAVRRRVLRDDPVQRPVPDRGVGLLDPADGGRSPAEPAARGRLRADRRAAGRPLRLPRRRRPRRPVDGRRAAVVPHPTTADPDWLTAVLPGSVLAGLAIGFAFAALGAAGAQALPPAQFGAGSAVGATARQLGAVVGVAGLVAVLGEPAPGERWRPSTAPGARSPSPPA
jgi:MFS family permease